MSFYYTSQVLPYIRVVKLHERAKILRREIKDGTTPDPDFFRSLANTYEQEISDRLRAPYWNAADQAVARKEAGWRGERG